MDNFETQEEFEAYLDNANSNAELSGEQRRKTNEVKGLIMAGVVFAVIFILYFGLPALVDNQDPDKSKLQNRMSLLQWLAGDQEPQKKDGPVAVGPFNSLFQ